MTFSVVPCSPAWKADFIAIRGQLVDAMGDRSARIEHIGSTSVDDLCAKPVIDVLVGAGSLADIESAIPMLERAGFMYVRKYEAELPMRRYFVRPAAAGPRVHVHAVCIGSRIWLDHLAFRDALRSDSGLRDAYATLKNRLALTHKDDKAAYGLAKAPFIKEVLASLALRATSNEA